MNGRAKHTGSAGIPAGFPGPRVEAMTERIRKTLRVIDTILPVLLAAGMTGYCLVFALRATSGVQWPYEWDAFRDIGAAQTMLDGRYPEDPILLGHTLWYNPLTAACNAAFSAATGVPLPQANVMLGPWLQLLTPAGFFVVLWVLFGRWAAVLGLAAFLFGKTDNIPAWNCATYSPWLFAPVLAEGFFYFTLAAFVLVRRKHPASLAWHALVGLLLALTFMTHTAPAVNAGGIMTVIIAVAAWRAWRGKEIQNPESRIQKGCGPGSCCEDKADERYASRRTTSREILLPFAVLLAVAFAASLPYTWSILRDYHFHVRNPWPGLYASSYVELAHFPERLRGAFNWRNLVAAGGAAVVLARPEWRRSALVPFAWAGLAALFLAQNYASQALMACGVLTTTLVPGHHAAIYLSAARWVFFGAGAAALGGGAAQLLLRAARRRDNGIAAILANAACCAAVLAAVIAGLFALRPYRDWLEMSITRNRAEYAAIHEAKTDMYRWVLQNTARDAVFLTEEDAVGLQVVMPAARKLSGTMLLYMNPYVDIQPLMADRRGMLDAMKNGNSSQFYEIARRRGVTHFLGRDKAPDGTPAAAPHFFREVHHSGGLVAYELETPAATGG